MTKHEREAKRGYFEFLVNSVSGDWMPTKKYTKVLNLLFEHPFRSTDGLDDYRAVDGIKMRFVYANDHPSPKLPAEASLLEVMVALAVRCEQDIAHDEELGDRTGQWFWSMIISLGFTNMDDVNFDYHKANLILKKFDGHGYEKNGSGGLFTVGDDKIDMRDLDIWYQMHKYLGEVLLGKGEPLWKDL